MATISTCPRCTRLVMLPEGFGPGDPMRCPLCGAEYPLSEALASVPPALIPVVELAGAEGTEAAERPETADDFLAGLSRTEELVGAAPAAESQSAAETAPLDAEGFTPIITRPSAEAEAAPLPGRRRKRKSKSVIRIALEVILGGLAGLLIAYYALWWIQRDSCQLPRFRWLPLLPPAQSADDGT